MVVNNRLCKLPSQGDALSQIFTARIRSMTGRYCFHRCLSVNISGGGYPISGLGRGVPHLRSGLGRREVPHLRSGGGGTPSQGEGYPISGGIPHVWGVPHLCPPPLITQSSIASTCYAVGGVPLEFTQEDFLVWLDFTEN